MGRERGSEPRARRTGESGAQGWEGRRVEDSLAPNCHLFAFWWCPRGVDKVGGNCKGLLGLSGGGVPAEAQAVQTVRSVVNTPGTPPAFLFPCRSPPLPIRSCTFRERVTVQAPSRDLKRQMRCFSGVECASDMSAVLRGAQPPLADSALRLLAELAQGALGRLKDVLAPLALDHLFQPLHHAVQLRPQPVGAQRP